MTRRNTLGRPLKLDFCISALCGQVICGCDYFSEGKITLCELCQRRTQCKIKRLYPTRGLLVSMLHFSGRENLRYDYQLRKNVCKSCGTEISSQYAEKSATYCPASKHL